MMSSAEKPAFRRSTRLRTALFLLPVAAVALGPRLPTWNKPFVYDDLPAVRDHPVVRGDLPWYTVFTAPYWPIEVSPDPLYRPVTTASLRLNRALWGHTPFAYRVVNSVLHALAAVLVAIVAGAVWRHAWSGPVAGLLFAVHPVNTEAVVTIVGRAEILAAIFSLAMLAAHLRFLQLDRRVSLGHHLLLAGLYLLACGSKESGVLAFVPLAAVDVYAARRRSSGLGSPREALRRWAVSHGLGLITVAAAYGLVRWAIFGWRTTMAAELAVDHAGPLFYAGDIERWLTPLALVSLSTLLLIVPVRLCPIWSAGSFALPTSPLAADVLSGAVIVGCLTLLACRVRRGRGAGILAAGVLVSLLAACQAVPMASWFFAERWLYLPCAFTVAWISGLTPKAPRTVVFVGSVLVGAFAAVSVEYQRSWRSNEAIVDATLARQPLNYKALVAKCGMLQDHDMLPNTAPFVARLEQAHPAHVPTWYYRAKWLMSQGRYREAKHAVERAAELLAGRRIDLRLTMLEEQIDRALAGARP